MLSDKVVASDEKGVRTITLQRPEKKNALDPEMFEALTHQLREAAADQEVKVVVLTGAGEHFSSGNDLGNFLTAVAKGLDPVEMAERGRAMLDNLVSELINFSKPLIAAVNGPTVGIMFTTLPLFDLVFASPTATFSAPFTKLGQVPEGCSSFTFPQTMGHSLATKVLLLGHILTVEEAKNIGLVTEVLDGSLGEAVARKAEQMMSLPQESLREGRRLLRSWTREQLHKANQEECRVLVERWQSEECMAAIVEFFASKKKAKL